MKYGMSNHKQTFTEVSSASNLTVSRKNINGKQAIYYMSGFNIISLDKYMKALF